MGDTGTPSRRSDFCPSGRPGSGARVRLSPSRDGGGRSPSCTPRVDAVAKGLLSLGIAPGDKVALWMVNRPEWIDAMFAIIKIGAVLVPVNTRFRTEDMAYILAQSDAAAVLLADRSGPVDYLGMMREVVPALGARRIRASPASATRWCSSDRAAADVTDWSEVLDRGTSRDRGGAARAGRPGRSRRTAPSSSTPRGRPGFPRGPCTTTASSGTPGITAIAWA